MTHWLVIDVEFLTSEYHGRADGKPEWPPNPLRLYQALISAANLGERTKSWSSKEAAFRWLEAQEPPAIISPEVRLANARYIYVPNNSAESKNTPETAGTMKKIVHPHVLDKSKRIQYVWEIRDEDWEEAKPHALQIAEEARFLHRLGWGTDLVMGDGNVVSAESLKEFSSGDTEVWVATKARGSRAPCKGTLDELLRRHQIESERLTFTPDGEPQLKSPPPPARAFHPVRYRPIGEEKGRSTYFFNLVSEVSDRVMFKSFDPTRTAIEGAAMARHAAHMIARDMNLDKDFIEKFVCGHGQTPEEKSDRLNFIPCPSVGRYVDGRVRRIMATGPSDLRLEAREILRRLDSYPLVSEEGEVKAFLSASDMVDGVTHAYTGVSRSWSSVTPMILPGYAKSRSLTHIVPLVLKALKQAGYTTPVVSVEPYFSRGQRHARDYKVPSYLRKWPSVFVDIEFAKPVSGPVLIGAGRHVGLGVFCTDS